MKSKKAANDATAQGKVRRKTVSREGLGPFDARLRRKTVKELLEAASVDRLPALLPLKRQRMSVSPFTFFRGAAAVMAYDLSLSDHTAIEVQLCGDAHVQNLGAYEGIDGKLIFDINDFDETIRGPFEWDVKRMATSILLAGRDAKIGTGSCAMAAEVFLDAYVSLMTQLSRLPVLDIARYAVRRLTASAPIAEVLDQAERASPARLLKKLTVPTRTGHVFRSHPPELRRVRGDERKAVLASLARYRASLLPERRHFLDQFEPVDVAFKVVGTGSVGLRDYCVYCEGKGIRDPLFLQVKQESQSVYAQYLHGRKKTAVEQGQRVAEGQRAMQLQSDPMLGWTHFGKCDYLVRQLNDHKASLDVTTLDATGLAAYSHVCGEILARGHARSGDARLIAGYLGGGKVFKAAILKFAVSYAELTVKDWKQYRVT
jgi:uncharacterized protein (DUF2252 family)